MQGDTDSWEISPHRPSLLRQLPDIWQRRRLFVFLFRRSVVDLYAQTVLGMAWLVIRPGFTVVAFTLALGTVLGVSTAPIPHLLFSLVSFSIWIVFGRGLVYGTRSIQRNSRIMRQFYFPRIMVHIASIGPALAEGLVVTICAVIGLTYFVLIGTWQLQVGWHTLLVIPALLLLLLLLIGVSAVTAVMNSYVRDTRYAISYASGALMLITPVFYPVTAVPARFQVYMWLNPLTSIMEVFRWAVFHVHEPRWDLVAVGAGACILAFVVGVWVFIKWEASALDSQ
jgi:lipopolysaccharide transport system permease protein